MKLLKAALFAGASIATANAATAMDHSHHMHMNHDMMDHKGHDSHALHYSPLNTMGTHSHKEGEVMLSYKFMKMSMNGLLDGDSNIDTSDVTPGAYMAAPESMTTDMHMVSAMYGLGGDFTAMAMIPYLEKEMEAKHMSGAKFNMKSEGLGDIKLGVTDSLTRTGATGWTAYYGISLPTGQIDKDDTNHAGTNMRLGYGMQMGSGTFDLTPAITYQNTCKHGIHFGAQGTAVIRVGENHKNYRLGNEFGLNLWAGKAFNEEFSTGLSLRTTHQNEIKGDAQGMNAGMSPTTDADNSGYTKSFAGFDISYAPKSLGGVKFLAGVDVPVYQKVEGIQGRSESMITFSIRKAF